MKRRDGVERLMLVVGVAIFVDTVFYAVITPLLPQLSHQLHLSKLSAGVMTASYPVGMLVASLPGGALAVRRGPRFTVITGDPEKMLGALRNLAAAREAMPAIEAFHVEGPHISPEDGPRGAHPQRWVRS